MWYLKLIFFLIVGIIFYQDNKDRMVYWFLYPIVGILAFAIQLKYLPVQTVLVSSGLNLLFVCFLLIVSFVYIYLRKLAFENAIGLGDILFFIFISFTFSTISFIVLFVFALLFSLVLHFVFQDKSTEKTVPLAGYMALFFGVVYGVTFFCNSNFLYAY